MNKQQNTHLSDLDRALRSSQTLHTAGRQLRRYSITRSQPPGTLLAVLWLAASLTACSKTKVDLSGRACKDGACLADYACHPETRVCVPAMRVSCADSNGVCPTKLETGGSCDAVGSFVPCDERVTDCEVGCRTCQEGKKWSACSAASCVPIDDGVEICDNHDNDCNGTIDDKDAKECVVYYLDADEDGFGDEADSQCLCSPSGLYTATIAGDCDDSPASGDCGLDCNPEAPELCDGFDNNCDKSIDPTNTVDCKLYFSDGDGDGFGDDEDKVCACGPDPSHTLLDGGDCDDGSKLCVATCTDVDTDGVHDCKDTCVDADEDGRGRLGHSSSCDFQDTVDCNDEPDDPQAELSWANCDSCQDKDGDGWFVDCDAHGEYPATIDCDDAPDVVDPTPDECGKHCHPMAPEVCDGVNNDCDDYVDGNDEDFVGKDCGLQVGFCAGATMDSEQCGTEGWNRETCIKEDYDGSFDRNSKEPKGAGYRAIEEGSNQNQCDGLDNDCDGKVDEDCPGLVQDGAFIPSNLPDGFDFCQGANGESFPVFEPDDQTTIDTDAGTITKGQGKLLAVSVTTHAQAPGFPEVAIFRFRSIKLIELDTTVTATGSRAVILTACDDIEIDDTVTINACASGTQGGPGGYSHGDTAAPGAGSGGTHSAAETIRGGGGGGGHCGTGGKGGNIAFGGNGGVSYPDSPSATPLRGGSPGGAGDAQDISNTRRGGGGGGAIQLIANRELMIDGIITACGAGGGGAGVAETGGGGGGAGGTIVLEAMNITLGEASILAANGGSGGGGCGPAPEGSDDTSGRDGPSDAGQAKGGKSKGDDSGDGYLGGGNPDPNGGGVDGNPEEIFQGGGGGAAGYIHIRSNGTFDNYATLSPANADTGPSCVTITLPPP